MDLHVDPLTRIPQPDMDAWNEAGRRLEDYLRAHGVNDYLRRQRILTALLAEAVEKRRADPGLAPIRAAIDCAAGARDRWLAGATPGPPENGVQLSWLLDAGAGGVAAAPAFEAPDPDPDVIAAVREKCPAAHPDMSISRMLPREMDYGPLETLETAGWAPVIRAFLLWSALWIVAFQTYQHFR